MITITTTTTTIIIIIIMTLIKYIHWVALYLDYATIFTILTKKDLWLHLGYYKNQKVQIHKNLNYIKKRLYQNVKI